MKVRDLVRADFPGTELSFWEGFASIFDFGSRSAAVHPVLRAEGDAQAIERDWQVIGKDMRKAFGKAGCR